jgi:hypothetical protein
VLTGSAKYYFGLPVSSGSVRLDGDAGPDVPVVVVLGPRSGLERR